MVKSKRTNKDKVAKTSKVEKKPKDQKITFVDTVKTLVGQFNTIFAIKINNMRTIIIKRIREDFKESKIVFGKKRLISMALGDSEFTEVYKESDALLLTDRTYEDVKETLSKYKSLEFARTGSKCTQSVKVLAQPLKAFSVDLQPTLRDLGMSVEIKDGVIILMQDYQICQKGEQLTNTMCRLLKFFNVQTAEFSVDVVAMCKDDTVTRYEISAEESEPTIPASVEIRCEELDDGKFYFMPHEVEEAVMDCE